MAFAFVLIGAMIVFGAYWSTMYFLETAPAKTPSTSTTKKSGTRRTTTRRTTTVIQDDDENSDDELSCKDGDCFDKKVKLKEEERNPKSQNSSQNNTTTYLVPTTAISIANLEYCSIPMETCTINRALISAAFMISLYLGGQYLLELDRQNNDIPIGNITGLG